MNQVQEILAEYADGFITGKLTLSDLVKKYDVLPGSELDALLKLAQELEHVLVMVAPTPGFISGLRSELLATKSATLLYRLRNLSRVQLAAGIGGLTVAAGIIWYARKSGFDIRLLRNGLASAPQEGSEASALAS